MNHSIEHESNKLTQRVLTQLGERLNCFYHQRFVALDNYLNGLLEDHDWCSDTITDAEIEGLMKWSLSICFHIALMKWMA